MRIVGCRGVIEHGPSRVRKRESTARRSGARCPIPAMLLYRSGAALQYASRNWRDGHDQKRISLIIALPLALGARAGAESRNQVHDEADTLP